MPNPTNLQYYSHIAEIFEAALAAGGGTVEFNSRAEAVSWRSQAYYYRKLLRDLSQLKADSPDMTERLTAGLTPYDDFYLSLSGSSITIHVARPKTGKFIPKGE